MMAPVTKNWQQILDEERMREASKRHLRRKRTPAREWAAGLISAAILLSFVFALFWQASGRGPIF